MTVEILMSAGGVIALLLAMFLTVRPYLPGSLFAYGAMWLFHEGNLVYFPLEYLMSWGVITLIIIAIDIMQPKKRWQPLTGSLYLFIGAVVGVFLGASVGVYWIIPGCVIGTILGALAYSRTPGGSMISFSSSTFIQYFCAYGFKVIVAVSMIGTVIGAYAYKHIAENVLNIN